MSSNSRSTTQMLYQCGAVFVIAVVAISSQLILPALGEGQRSITAPKSDTPPTAVVNASSVDRAINSICEARRRDAQGTIPIDQMAFAPPLPSTDSRVSAAKARATALLPIAKRLVPFAVRRVAIANGVEPKNPKWIITRVQAIKTITPDPSLRDNALWRPSEPDTIFFGTVFLAGLRSDEAMLAVLAHELTHAVNGTDKGLDPVFTRFSKRILPEQVISENVLVELVCEMVGLETVRDYINQTKRRRLGTGLRLGRALQKDCVQTDLSDEHHLSPRETMRMLLQIDVGLVNTLSGEKPGPAKKALTKGKPRHRKPINNLVVNARHMRISLVRYYVTRKEIIPKRRQGHDKEAR